MLIDERGVVPAVIDGGTWSASFGLSWTAMMMHDQVRSMPRIVRPGGMWLREVAGTMGVAEGRNKVARAFLATDARWLFMVDSDMGFTMDTVDRMVDSAVRNNANILGALCFSQRRKDEKSDVGSNYFTIQPTMYNFVEVASTKEQGFIPVKRYERNAYQSVGATGAACVLINRDVLTYAQYKNHWFDPITISGAGGNGTSRTFSEDLSFCIRARSAGFTIGVDTSIRTGHHKGGIYLDENTYDNQERYAELIVGRDLATQARLAMGVHP